MCLMCLLRHVSVWKERRSVKNRVAWGRLRGSFRLVAAVSGFSCSTFFLLSIFRVAGRAYSFQLCGLYRPRGYKAEKIFHLLLQSFSSVTRLLVIRSGATKNTVYEKPLPFLGPRLFPATNFQPH